MDIDGSWKLNRVSYFSGMVTCLQSLMVWLHYRRLIFYTFFADHKFCLRRILHSFRIFVDCLHSRITIRCWGIIDACNNHAQHEVATQSESKFPFLKAFFLYPNPLCALFCLRSLFDSLLCFFSYWGFFEWSGVNYRKMKIRKYYTSKIFVQSQWNVLSSCY